jgi:hypothetical protein
MPLHAVTTVHGEAGLEQRLLIEIAALPAADRTGPGRQRVLLVAGRWVSLCMLGIKDNLRPDDRNRRFRGKRNGQRQDPPVEDGGGVVERHAGRAVQR